MKSKLVVDSLRSRLWPIAPRYPAMIARILSTRHKGLWVVTHLKAVLCRLRRMAARSESAREQYRYKELWYRGIYDEVLWWEGWLAAAQGLQWQAEVQRRQRPVREPLLADRLGGLAQGLVSILDVGSGPVTSLGNTFPGKVLDIVAIDPLADVYRRTLRDMGVAPLGRTLSVHGEQLLERFAPESFDFVYARNSLDHSCDPVRVIQNMLVLVKEQGFVLLRHYRNEGKTGRYSGLHQWNFDLQGGSFVVWNEDEAYDLSQMFCREAQIECHLEDSRNFGGFDHSEWVVCAMKKTASAQRAG